MERPIKILKDYNATRGYSFKTGYLIPIRTLGEGEELYVRKPLA